MRLANFKTSEKSGPGLLFILIALIVAAVVGAKFFGFYPGAEKEKGIDEQVPDWQEEQLQPDELETLPQVPSVLIIHTHACENYSPKESHAKGGNTGDVVAVGKELAKALETEGVKVIHDTTIHDWPAYSEAYNKSHATVERALSTHPDLKVILDIHRDGLQDKPEGYTTVKIGDESVAKILLVIGDVANEEADSNTAFAEVLRERMDKRFPGLCRGIKILHGNFNGHLHPNTATAFIGDFSDNTVDEAKASARLFAQVLADYLRDLEDTNEKMNEVIMDF